MRARKRDGRVAVSAFLNYPADPDAIKILKLKVELRFETSKRAPTEMRAKFCKVCER